MTVIEIRGQAFVLVGPNGQEETLTSPALQGMRASEIKLVNNNAQHWVGITGEHLEAQIKSQLQRTVRFARSEVANRAMPRGVDGQLLPPVDGATYEEVSESELREFVDRLYRHICELPTSEARQPAPRRCLFGRR